MDTSTKEELFRKVWAALYEEGNKDELQVREVVNQMYMAVTECRYADFGIWKKNCGR